MKYEMRDRVLDRLNGLQAYLNRLNSFRADDLDGYKNADPVIKYATERRLQLINDAELDVIVLLYKKFGDEIAGSPSSMEKGLSSVLSKRLLESFDKRRELRNKLVHVYKEFSFDDKVFEQSKDTEDVAEFIVEIKKLIDKRWT